MDFDYNTILEKIEKLNKALSCTYDAKTIFTLEQDLKMLENILESFNTPETNNPPKDYKTTYQSLKLYFNDMDFFFEDIQKFYSLTTKKMFNVPSLTPKVLTQNDLSILTHDFYTSLNPLFRELFRIVSKNSYIHFEENPDLNYFGEMYFLRYTKESFIKINRELTIQDFFSLVHEYAHAINHFLNPQCSDSKNLYFCEIISELTELLAANYYEKNVHDGEGIIYKANDFNENVLIAREIRAFLKLMEKEQESGIKFQNPNTRKIIYKNSLHNQIYLTAYLFVIEFYQLFKNNPIWALKILHGVLTTDFQKPEVFYNEIKELGIIPNSSFADFYTSLKEDVLSLNLHK